MKRYVMLLQVGFCRLSEHEILIEGAFWTHAILLRRVLESEGYALEVALFELTVEEEKAQNFGWSKIDVSQSKLVIHSINAGYIGNLTSRARRLFSQKRIFCNVAELVKGSDVVHTGLSTDIYLPSSFFGVLLSIIYRKGLIFIVDMDFKNTARMLYRSREWGIRTFLLTTLVHDSHKRLQMLVATKYAHLSLLKGQGFAERYRVWGRNVESFYDVAHSADQVITEAELLPKLELNKASAKLKLVYFGRLLKYKGIQDAIAALGRLSDTIKDKVQLTIIGGGSYQRDLEGLVESLGLSNMVKFKGPLPYGQTLFSELQKHQCLVAFPNKEDTPRNVFDAMANGLAILAYDTYYYKELEVSSAVITVEWQNVSAIAQKLTELVTDRSWLEVMPVKAVEFARTNTQDYWLERRMKLTKDALNGLKSHSEIRAP